MQLFGGTNTFSSTVSTMFVNSRVMLKPGSVKVRSFFTVQHVSSQGCCREAYKHSRFERSFSFVERRVRHTTNLVPHRCHNRILHSNTSGWELTGEGLFDEVAEPVVRVGADLRVRHVWLVLVPQLDGELLLARPDIGALQQGVRRCTPMKHQRFGSR